MSTPEKLKMFEAALDAWMHNEDNAWSDEDPDTSNDDAWENMKD